MHRLHLLRDEVASTKPFQLVKFFSFASLAVLLLSTLALTVVITRSARSFLMERSEAYALVLAENLSHQVLSAFVLPTLVQYKEIRLSDDRQYRALDRVVRNTIHGLNIERVNIYDSEQNVISYSTDASLRGRRDAGGEEYRLALAGKSNSRFVSASPLALFGDDEGVASQRLQTFIPFRPSPESEQIMGVIEIVQDLSDDLRAIDRFRSTVLGVSLAIMAVLFVVLRHIVARADRIIEQRAEERRRLEEKLNQAERLAGLGKMVASVSHEIKNPLGIIMSTAEILRKKGTPETAHLAEIVVTETRRLDGIVREFLDFARPQTPRLAPVELEELCRRVLDFAGPQLEKQGIAVELLAGENTVCLGDEGLLYRALLNIVVNAVQAMADGGELAIRCGTAGAEVYCEIRDSGPGMDEGKKAQIFQPFFTDKHRGTGLGLAIVANIVESHHGRIEVESAPGAGTCFRLWLPAASP